MSSEETRALNKAIKSEERYKQIQKKQEELKKVARLYKAMSELATKLNQKSQ